MEARLALLTLAIVVVCGEKNARTVISERNSLPSFYNIHQDIADPTEKLYFSILLKQRNLDRLDEIFHEVSNPKSGTYGQFLTRTELDNLIRPDPAAFAEVGKWLAPYRTQMNVVMRADSVKVFTTVGVASQLLKTQFKAVRHLKTDKLLFRHFGQASVPARLAPHVDFIAGISELFSPKDVQPHFVHRAGAATPSSDDILITPPVLRTYYNVPADLQVTNASNLQGIAAFADYFSEGALAEFEADQGLAPANITRMGPDCFPTCDQGESDLDVQYITAMARNISTLFITQSANYWILEFTEEILAMNPIPYVFSISYGWSGELQCQIAVTNCQKYGYDSEQYVNRTNVDFQKLGAMGVTVLVSDGDDGAPSLGGASGNCPLDHSKYCPLGGCQHTKSACTSFTVANETTNNLCFVPMGLSSGNCSDWLSDPRVNDMIGTFLQANSGCNLNLEQDVEQNPHLYSTCACDKLTSVSTDGYRFMPYVFSPDNGQVFTPDYPTSSPWVTSVGATQFKSDDGVTVSSEISASILTGAIISTGGGFSQFQAQPSYQAKAVQQYLNAPNAKLPPSFAFNSAMRGYPDIAFNGHNYKIFISNGNNDTCPCTAIPVDGTSCSSPALAGLISLINDRLLNEGKSSLGFLNYLLYQMHAEYPEALHDITVGNNNCNRAYCCQYGYSAVKSVWDPISGLGSPNFVPFMNYILKQKGVSAQS